MTTTHASPTAQLPHFSLVIDGQLTEPVSGRSYDSVDPFSGAPWATAADGGEADVNLAVAAARRALAGPWGQLTGFGRARLMRSDTSGDDAGGRGTARPAPSRGMRA